MRKVMIAAVVASALATLAIGLAGPALADNYCGTVVQPGPVALPGPVPVYPQDTFNGSANPYLPYRTNPFVPYGVRAQH
jgi:hypothetical protein